MLLYNVFIKITEILSVGVFLMKKFENNLSQGSVVKQLILFSLPFLLSNLIQSLYNFVDMVIVGQFCGTISMSGVNIGSQLIFVISNMVFGLCVGATVLIGQYLGAGNKDAMRETIGTLLSTLVVVGIGLTAICLVLQNPILHLIKTPEESFKETQNYFFTTMLGTIFIFIYNALSAIMRGMGDSKNPLLFITIACVTNVVLDLLFVGVFHMGASGAAIATVIAQALSMFLCIFYLKKNNFIFDFKLSSFKFYPERLKTLLRIGIPTSIQNVATGASFLFLTSLVNGLGYVASAAVGAVSKINNFAILPAMAMSSSISAMSAQNIGAGEQQRAKKTLYVGMIISVIISFIVFVLIQLFPEYVFRIFDDDAEMISAGITYIRTFSLDYLIVPFVFCFNGLFIGAGHTTFSLISGIISALLVRIPAAYIIGIYLGYGLGGFGLGAPLASLISLILVIVFFVSGKWKKATILKG